ncbi:MAG: xanthine dehydrogenase family protein molybdopterin-binding subunit [Alicyclobacillus sp.]|nr:xanthine dehydrogenase family protein molybdopterin-binding subunit [Alicyclobacillus sp.]
MRKDAEEKVTGRAEYTADVSAWGMLHAALLASPYAHARIVSIDTQRAITMPGVRAVVTGADYPQRTGLPIADRPLLAVDVVRYAGEPVALVVADELYQAEAALRQLDVVYHPLPALTSPREAFAPEAVRLHPDLAAYDVQPGEEVWPVPGTNIATHVRIRKGQPESVWSTCDAVVTCDVSFPQAHHAPMETHCVIASVAPDGCVNLVTATQSPYSVPEAIARTFGFRPSDVRVRTPLVGGAFGGKSSVYLEPLAVAATLAVGGRPVKLRCTREQEMRSMPCHIGLEARIRLGARADGRFVAVEITDWFDGGGYSDRGVIVTRAAAQDCTGPYRIDHVHCDAYCMYTNHPPTTSYRGFGHPEQTLVMERAIDLLAEQLRMDPLELRRRNAVRPGDTTPTQARLMRSSVGDVEGCLTRLRSLLPWDGPPVEDRDGEVIAKGISCFWKTSSTPPDASSGALVYVNEDSTVTLLSGLVEIGQGTKTTLAQMVAEVLGLAVEQVRVVMEVDTAEQPEHWKTVASRGSLLAGNAAVRAARDARAQLAATAAVVFQCRPEDVCISNGYAGCPYTSRRIPIGQLSRGYTFPDGHTVGGFVVGRGSYTIERVTLLDPATGRGVPGPEWTVAAQGVVVAFRPRDYTYRVLRAVTVVDVGRVISPNLAEGQLKGGMSMGLSLGSREGYVYGATGSVDNNQLRVYPIHRYGDQPEYRVAFLETPNADAPWGLRGLGEHGVIGMPAALANALSNALGQPVNSMPMTPELLWRLHTGAEVNDR